MPSATPPCWSSSAVVVDDDDASVAVVMAVELYNTIFAEIVVRILMKNESEALRCPRMENEK